MSAQEPRPPWSEEGGEKLRVRCCCCCCCCSCCGTFVDTQPASQRWCVGQTVFRWRRRSGTCTSMETPAELSANCPTGATPVLASRHPEAAGQPGQAWMIIAQVDGWVRKDYQVPYVTWIPGD